MTHLAPMADNEGEFASWLESDNEWSQTRHKPDCAKPNVRFRSWESSCGGYEDYQYRCFTCGVTWWVDGPDA